ncbi:GntR family transcriptional regulator [Blautia liquoris]|jgi:DNA-binding transcriptional regulator YhcF (GntR family)|uniref:GntR family transcriptional regulator n=1 Tax=Blautia liquoris TaxID=2779518 RepID=A0A7M2RDU8_9FIRM|nr:GntR family transcriptional regulator [Blautia liquoris]QOV18144.1 GntR family transcriptional regulator [Blautia liquoris]
MAWDLDSGRPIYTQLVERIELTIVSGYYKPGDKLPSVRELAVEAGVNPNTMQKAMSELEREGLLFTERTSGRFVTEDSGMIDKTREELASVQIREFMEKMIQMGFGKEEILSLLHKNLKEERV